MKLRDYFAVSKIVATMMTAYRLEFMMWVILSPMALLIKYFVWKSLFDFNAVQTIAGYSFGGIIAYYAMVHAMGGIVWTDEDWEMSKSVNSGGISREFTRPASIYLIDLFNGFGTKIFGILFQVMPMTIIIFIFFKIQTAGLVFTLLSLASFCLAYLLNFNLAFAFGLSSFWMKEYYGVGKAKNTMINLTSGSLVPLDVMPLFLRNFFEKLPFAYISYYPAKIFTGAFSVNECLLILLKEVLWIIALYAAGQLIWKKAVKKFTGEGV